MIVIVSIGRLVIEYYWLVESEQRHAKPIVLSPRSLQSSVQIPTRDDIPPFTMENIGCQNKTIKAPCGSSKCFFQLPSNPGLGYVVTNFNEHALMSAQTYRNWTVYLQNRYGILPLPLGSPQTIRKAPKSMLACLNDKRWKANSEDQHLPNFRKSKGRLLVQLNRAAPSPSILFKCVDFLEEFLNDDEFKGYWRSIPDYTSYLLTVQDEIQLAQQILRESPDLLIDFQVLVDQTGKMSYLDLGHRKPGRWHLALAGKRLQERQESCQTSFPLFERVAREQAERYQSPSRTR